MKIYNNPDNELLKSLLKRPTKTVNDIETVVNSIFEDIESNGNTSVLKYTSKFDGIMRKSDKMKKYLKYFILFRY